MQHRIGGDANDIENMPVVKNLTNLLDSCKQVVYSQDQILNKSIVKSQAIRPTVEFNYNNSRFKLPSDKEYTLVTTFLTYLASIKRVNSFHNKRNTSLATPTRSTPAKRRFLTSQSNSRRKDMNITIDI